VESVIILGRGRKPRPVKHYLIFKERVDALKKINDFRAQGCEIWTEVGGRKVGIENK